MATAPKRAILRAGRAAPLAWVFLAGLASSACLPELAPPKAATAPAAPTTAEAAAVISEDPQGAAYVYSPTGKRDPFRDPSTTRVVVSQPTNMATTALQRFDIDQLRLVFTNTATATPMAMIVDPSGRTHMVQIGDFVGKNWGKISSIKREELEITETIADPNTGRIYPVFIPLRMLRPETDKSGEPPYDLRVLPGNP